MVKKIWTGLSSVLSQITRVTDGRTDGRTDRILIARPRLHYMQRGKNDRNLCISCTKPDRSSRFTTSYAFTSVVR